MTVTDFPDVGGTVSLEADALVLRRSWVRRLRSQILRWRQGGPLRRLFAVLSVVVTLSMPVVIVWYLALALLVDPWWAAGPTDDLYFGAIGGLFVITILYRSLRPRKIPLSRLEDGVSKSGPRTLHLPADAFGRLQSLVRLWTRPTITFVRSEDRDRLVSHLEERGVDVDPG